MFKDKLKKYFNRNKEDEGQEKTKRKIENLVVFAIILIITIISINLIWNGDKKESSENTTSSKILAKNNEISLEQKADSITTNELEVKLKNILSKIQGVGQVEVFINYSESSEVIPMYNENSQTSLTEETDTSGGVRKIQETDTQKEIIYQEDSGSKEVITQKVIEPKIEGAIITAEGAGDVNVKTNIIQAVEATTGLATHKIQVFVME
mgnify:FL=1